MAKDYAAEPYEKLARDGPELRVSAELVIRYHTNGALSVSGNVGDPKLAHWLLDQARDAITRQQEKTLVIPASAVGALPT